MVATIYRIALYFRGPKLSRLEHTKQFHEIIFTISGMHGPSLLRVLLHQSWQYMDGDGHGISLVRQSPVGLGKAHLELLVAACNNI